MVHSLLDGEKKAPADRGIESAATDALVLWLHARIGAPPNL